MALYGVVWHSTVWYGLVWRGTVWYGVANIQATFRHCQVSAANSINHHTAMLIITKAQSDATHISN